MTGVRDNREELLEAHRSLQEIYNASAQAYDEQRAKFLFEQPWIDRFLESLPDQPALLDVGCGSGEPIAAYVISKGCSLTGIDFATAMLAIARSRYPAHSWLEADMRKLALRKTFHGVLSWNAFFHLTRDEQRHTIPRLAGHVAPGGSLMLTIGPDDGEGMGKVDGKPVYHASLAQQEYNEILHASGFEKVQFALEDPDCNDHSVVLATNKKP